MAEQLVVLVQEYDLEGNPVITRFTNPRIWDLESTYKHNKRVCGKPSNVVEYSRINA